jgi:hypothetical protein
MVGMVSSVSPKACLGSIPIGNFLFAGGSPVIAKYIKNVVSGESLLEFLK